MIKGITFDFYQTLIHGQKRGRGQRYHDYLAEHGITADPWEHTVLYDLFAYYGSTYRVDMSADEKSVFWTEFVVRLFARTSAEGNAVDNPAKHSDATEEIFGPAHFSLYDDVLPTLDELKRRGIRMAIVSNWQCGLTPFCVELGIADYFDAIIASAEVKCDKPDSPIFAMAFRPMKLTPEDVMHIGDNPIDDLAGAVAAGCVPILLDRNGVFARDDVIVVQSLEEILSVVASL